MFSRETTELLTISQRSVVKRRHVVLAFGVRFPTEIIDTQQFYVTLCNRRHAAGCVPPGSSQPMGACLPRSCPFPGAACRQWLVGKGCKGPARPLALTPKVAVAPVTALKANFSLSNFFPSPTGWSWENPPSKLPAHSVLSVRFLGNSPCSRPLLPFEDFCANRC